MTFYKKRQRTIEAVQFIHSDGMSTLDECLDFIGEAAEWDQEANTIMIVSPRGLAVPEGSYVEKDENGNMIVWGAEEFKTVYER